MGPIFVSYRHHQREWVWERLVPALEAGGVEVIIDRDRFLAGERVVGQMDHAQDRADATIVVLTPQYLDSLYCMHELERGVARHKVIPVVQEECEIPGILNDPHPILHVDLREPESPYPWGDLLDACEAPEWTLKIDRVVRFLERGQSVNLVCLGAHLWRDQRRDRRRDRLRDWRRDRRRDRRRDICLLPFVGLDRLLVAYHETSSEPAENEINRLIDSYPSQKHQALRARARLLAREAAAQSDLTKVIEPVQRLPIGDKAFLAQTGIVKEGAARVAQLQSRIDAIDRPVFRESTARQLIDEIERFRGQVSGLREPLASEFRAAALAWKQVAERQFAGIQSAVLREPAHQVFRAGDPVNRGQEAFIPRVNVIGKLEQQVMLATGCPGVILYGRRRRGKSSALRNLTGLGLLPVSVRAATISMQEPKAFSSLAAFAGRIAQEIAPELPGGATPETLSELFDLLSRYNQQLASRKERLILALDEYENIDLKIGEGVFSLDLLATIRESIQTHRSITWLFAGSHTIEELPNAPWTSYLVSARTIEVSNFTLDETRLLLTEPMKYSQDWAKDSTDRPRFDSSFWGEGGIERIQHETDGWPHLVQLIAETCVDLVNEGNKRVVTPQLLEKALDEAIVRGHTVMYELMHRESELPGEWQYLSRFRERETQTAPEDLAVRRSLLRREVAMDDGAAWRLRVPLMGRWLRERG